MLEGLTHTPSINLTYPEQEARHQALQALEVEVSSLRLKILSDPDETENLCRLLLNRLATIDKLLGGLDARRGAVLEMSLTNFLAQALVEAGKWDEAAATYKHCLDLGVFFQEPEFQADSLVKLGRAYRHANKFEAAHQCFEQAVTLCESYGLFDLEAEAVYQQAVVAELQHHPKYAFELYRNGLRLAQKQGLSEATIRFSSQLGQLHQSQGDYPLALTYYRQCLQTLRENNNDPESMAIILGQISQICRETDDYEGGIIAGYEGLKLSEQANQAALAENFLNDLARFHLRRLDYVQASNYAQQARLYAQKHANVNSIGKLDKLLVQIAKRESQKDEPKLTALQHYQAGNHHYRQAIFDLAITAYNQALHQDAHFVKAYINRGSAYAAQGHYDRALADYSRAIELDDNDAVAFFNRGNAYRKRREYTRALADYSRAIELAPGDPDAYFNRGEVLRRLNRLDEARHDLKQVVELSEGQGATQARQLLTDLGFAV